MAPKRKSRSVYKRFSVVNEDSPSKDDGSKKSMQRKRKLSDMLGSQWNKEELERFYDAFRKYGKDWKKVGAAVRNRSVEMVEALYTMNRAYLSLPEGIASVVGFIAMMTDHYFDADGSESGQESNDGEASQNAQNRVRSKLRTDISKGSEEQLLSHSQTSASNSDCLSLLKKKRSGGSRPWAVGKRTPRYPVTFSYDKGASGKLFTPTRQGLKLKGDANDDDVAHEVALALAKASQRGGSPQASQTPSRRTRGVMTSPIRRGERMDTELKLTNTKLGSNMDEDSFGGNLGGAEVNKFEFAGDRSSFMQTEGADTAVRKGRRVHGKKPSIDYAVRMHWDDSREACSGTEGQSFGVKVGKASRTPSQVSKKKSNKALFSGDEVCAFDALQTLADLSLMMPATASENESSVQVKDDDLLADKYDIVETLPVADQLDRPKSSGVKAKGASVAKMSKLGKVSDFDATSVPEAKEEPQQSPARFSKKKQKTFMSSIPRTEVHTEIHMSEPQEAEARDIGKKHRSKGVRSSFSTFQQKQGTLVTHLEHSLPSADLRGEKSVPVLSSPEVPVATQVDLPYGIKSKHKIELQQPQNLKDLHKFLNNQRPTVLYPSSVQDGALNLKVMLSNCLSNPRVRKRCAFEWFYSAIDYPWFAKREFVEYLSHVGLGHVPRLTRVEWGVIRSSLGKPRRFSEQFLKEEKEKLNQYRDSVRKHYTELRAGTKEGLPTDLARPLCVGQHVMAIHPRTREIHDGNVLTVDHNRCRVQFHRPELGVEFVLDIDCMPLNPLENMPASISRNTVGMDKLFANFNQLQVNSIGKHQKLEGLMAVSSGGTLECVDVPVPVSPAHPSSNLLHQMQAKEADVQALAELTRALDKKEAVVAELKHMNDTVSENLRDGDNALKDSESFKKQYAAVLVQLNIVNDQVAQALRDLRKRNTYHVSSPLALPKTTVNVGDSGGLLNSCDLPVNQVQNSGPHVHEIVEKSRKKARKMVDAAMQHLHQGMSALKVGGNPIGRIEEAIDYISSRLPLDDSCAEATRSCAPSDPIQGSLISSPGQEIQMEHDSNGNAKEIPSELITHCVATLLMIQNCTERQFPPADVVEILDSAVITLQPSCSQNLLVYSEIQKCIGIVRNQILARMPA